MGRETMDKLKFYEINTNYIQYLKKYDHRVPNIDYKEHNKFLCGVVLDVNGNKYYAPVSSFCKEQQTNFIIKNNKGKSIASLRLSFMLPVPDRVLTIKNFKDEDYKYRRLLMEELKYCNDNLKAILIKANKVYRIAANERHPLNLCCCNFKLLEQKCLEYKTYVSAIDEVATTIEEDRNIDIENDEELEI